MKLDEVLSRLGCKWTQIDVRNKNLASGHFRNFVIFMAFVCSLGLTLRITKIKRPKLDYRSKQKKSEAMGKSRSKFHIGSPTGY